MILVTGGTGLVGSHLLYFLLKENENVRAIKRSNSNIKPVQDVFNSYGAAHLFNTIEWINADILDVPSLENAFMGVETVFHCAAKVSFATTDYKELLKVNIEGTANVVNLCIANRIKKLYHVSSVATLGESINGKPITEDTHWNPEANNNGYAISKFGAEMEVWRGSQEGLDVVIVQPSIVLGEGHWKSASGSLFSTIKKGIPRYPKGGTGFIDVRDVAKALCALMESDVKNESFILSSTNSTYQDSITQIAIKINANAPKTSVENWQLSVVAFLQKINHIFTGKKPSLNKETIYSLQNISEYDGSKITKVIPFSYTQIDDTINRVSKAFLKQ